jgi:hypothetical protein
MMNAAAPSVGGERIAPIPASRLPRISAALQDRPGDRGERHGRRRPRSGDRAQEESGERRGATRARARLAEGREAHVYKVFSRSRVLQNRPVYREEDYVSRRHVQRHAEESFETHVGLAHDPVRPVADVPDPGPDRDQGAEIGVRDEEYADGGQYPPYRPPRRFKHEQYGHEPEHEIQRLRTSRPPDELVEDHQRVAERDDGENGEEVVRNPRVVRGALRPLGLTFPPGLARASPGPVENERHRERDGEKAGPIDLSGYGVEDPVESVAGEPHPGDREQELREPGELAGRLLGLEFLDKMVRANSYRIFEPHALATLAGASVGHSLILSLAPSSQDSSLTHSCQRASTIGRWELDTTTWICLASTGLEKEPAKRG